jgi:tetratricopeptide (TPR) repeat protein
MTRISTTLREKDPMDNAERTFRRWPLVRVLFILGTVLAFGLAGAFNLRAQANFRKPLGYRVPGMDKVEVHNDVTYKNADQTDLKMDVYVPPGLAAGKLAPIVFFIHGGYLPRTMPLNPKDWGVFQSYGRLAAASGFLGVTFNHRYWGWTREDMERSFGDVIDAIRYVRDHAATYRADADHIGLWAFSGGGPHLSLVQRNKLEFVRCLVSFYAILDMVPQARMMSIDTDKEKLAEFSPINYLQDDAPGFPPMFIGRAGLDSPAINEAADRFIARALALNETIEVANHADGRHGFDIYNDDARAHEIIARAFDFLKAHIGSTETEGRSLPTAGRLQGLLLEGKAAKAKELYQVLSDRTPSARGANSPYAQVLSEANLAVVGRSLLAGKNAQAASEILRWSVELYPESPAAADALAESYEILGQRESALEYSERVRPLIEKARGLDSASRARLLKSAEERTKRLKVDINTLVGLYSAQQIIALDVGESALFKLKSGAERSIRLISADEQQDSLIHLVRRAEVRVEIDGVPLVLVCMPYVMPTNVAGLRIQADTTSGWKNIEKRVQLSVWDATDPAVDTARFVFPIRAYRLFSHGTQGYDEPVYLGAGDDDPTGQKFYHDYGFDMAGFEGGEAVCSAVDGDVVRFWPSREDICSVLIQDRNGAVWEHAHLRAVEPGLVLKSHVVPGQRIGTLGKTGPSGNFAHLHVGTYLQLRDASPSEGEPDRPNRRLNLYPWLVTAYQALHPEGICAVARPHHTVLTGEKVVLDGTNSLAWGGRTIVEYRWILPAGETIRHAKAELVLNKPGAYVAALWVKDNHGRQDVDFCQIKAFSKNDPEKAMPHIYMSYTPTEGIHAGQPVRFRFWMQGQAGGPITVAFDDGTPIENYKSYSEFSHGFKTSGLHVVTARCEVDGRPVTQKVKVVVDEAPHSAK